MCYLFVFVLICARACVYIVVFFVSFFIFLAFIIVEWLRTWISLRSICIFITNYIFLESTNSFSLLQLFISCYIFFSVTSRLSQLINQVFIALPCSIIFALDLDFEILSISFYISILSFEQVRLFLMLF